MTFKSPGVSKSPVLSSQETRRGEKGAEVWRREEIHGSVKNSSFSTERERIKAMSGRKHAAGSFTVDVSCSCITIRKPETSLAGRSRFQKNQDPASR